MFMFLDAKHGISSKEASRPKRPRCNNTQQLRNGDPLDFNRRSKTFREASSPRPLPLDVQKLKKEVDSKLQVIEESLDPQDRDSLSAGENGPVDGERTDRRPQNERLQQHEHETMSGEKPWSSSVFHTLYRQWPGSLDPMFCYIPLV